jgi:hypothetical protein
MASLSDGLAIAVDVPWDGIWWGSIFKLVERVHAVTHGRIEAQPRILKETNNNQRL